MTSSRESSTGAPRFSIVIPVYNRSLLARRAIESCLRQPGDDFEVIVVDDGSSDRFSETLGKVVTSRVRVVRHPENLGVSPARNTGVQSARGDWIIMLDSDDELQPDGLARIRRRVNKASAAVARLAFVYELANGGYSPAPPLREGVWDYKGYMAWAGEKKRLSDFLSVTRTDALRIVSYPRSRAPETFFHLDFALRFQTDCFSDVVGILNSDAPNRSSSASPRQRRRDAPSTAVALEELLDRHEPALAEVAPRLLFEYRYSAMLNHLLAGHRRRALQLARTILRDGFFSTKVAAVTLLGLISPILLSIAQYRLTQR